MIEDEDEQPHVFKGNQPLNNYTFDKDCNSIVVSILNLPNLVDKLKTTLSFFNHFIPGFRKRDLGLNN